MSERNFESMEANERRFDIEKDTEMTARLLGALGLYDASQDEYENPAEALNRWAESDPGYSGWPSL